MSTRSNIVIKSTNDYSKDIQLYKHLDGYPDGPDGVINELQKALEYAWDLPRMESNDFAAAIIASWADHKRTVSNVGADQLIYRGGNIYIDGEYKADGSTLSGDIEWFYFIEADQKVQKWKVTVKETCKNVIAWVGHIGDDYDPEKFILKDHKNSKNI